MLYGLSKAMKRGLVRPTEEQVRKNVELRR
jgi:hypothetical protein